MWLEWSKTERGNDVTRLFTYEEFDCTCLFRNHISGYRSRGSVRSWHHRHAAVHKRSLFPHHHGPVGHQTALQHGTRHKLSLTFHIGMFYLPIFSFSQHIEEYNELVVESGLFKSKTRSRATVFRTRLAHCWHETRGARLGKPWIDTLEWEKQGALEVAVLRDLPADLDLDVDYDVVTFDSGEVDKEPWLWRGFLREMCLRMISAIIAAMEGALCWMWSA